MKKVGKYLWENIEVVCMIVLLDIFIVNVFLGIVSRLIFNSPLVFTEEVSRYLFIWMVFLGLPYSTKAGKHISLDLVQKRLPLTARYVVTVLIHLVTAAVFAWVLYYGINYMFFVADVKTPVLQISKSIIFSIIPFTSLMMLLRTGERLVIENREYRVARKMKKENTHK